MEIIRHWQFFDEQQTDGVDTFAVPTPADCSVVQVSGFLGNTAFSGNVGTASFLTGSISTGTNPGAGFATVPSSGEDSQTFLAVGCRSPLVNGEGAVENFERRTSFKVSTGQGLNFTVFRPAFVAVAVELVITFFRLRVEPLVGLDSEPRGLAQSAIVLQDLPPQDEFQMLFTGAAPSTTSVDGKGPDAGDGKVIKFPDVNVKGKNLPLGPLKERVIRADEAERCCRAQVLKSQRNALKVASEFLDIVRGEPKPGLAAGVVVAAKFGDAFPEFVPSVVQAPEAFFSQTVGGPLFLGSILVVSALQLYQLSSQIASIGTATAIVEAIQASLDLAAKPKEKGSMGPCERCIRTKLLSQSAPRKLEKNQSVMRRIHRDKNIIPFPIEK